MDVDRLMHFAQHGVAALLYDKRDVGHEPSGTDLVDLRDLAGDALAAVALLKARNDIPRGIGSDRRATASGRLRSQEKSARRTANARRGAAQTLVRVFDTASRAAH